jgi:predicted nucleotidyltransferase
MIKLSEKELQLVKNILKNYVSNFEVLVFGSRVSGNTHEHSDLDIALKGPDKIDLLLLADIKDELQNSDLPFRVDIIDFNRISAEFQKVISSNHSILKLD